MRNKRFYENVKYTRRIDCSFMFDATQIIVRERFSIPFKLRSGGTGFKADRLKVTHCGPFIIVYDLFFSLQSVALWAVLTMYVGDGFFCYGSQNTKTGDDESATFSLLFHFPRQLLSARSTSAWNYEITTQAKAKSRLYWGPLENNRRFKSDYITFVNFRSRWHFTRINKTKKIAYSVRHFFDTIAL